MKEDHGRDYIMDEDINPIEQGNVKNFVEKVANTLDKSLIEEETYG